MRKIIILSAATLILSSCGIYNKYKPVSEVPEVLYGRESVAATDTANFGNLSWREVFTDPYLQNLVDSALLRNTDMQTAHLRVKEAEATLLTSKLSYLPSPGQFIPALEKGGYISELDRYMIEKVTGCLDQRRAEKKRFVPVSVNLSWMDFYDENMLEWIVRGLKKNNPNEQKIRFEITETSLAAIGENHTRMLMHLKENGAEILLDDFGSGYSSFGMLQDYDFDILKMDISFVRNIGVNKKSESILRAIIDMAHQLEIRLVAEGAETEEQVAFLRANGCDYIQGYYYYKPMPENEFLQLLDEGK